MERVAVIGVGQTDFSAERAEATYADLAYEAARKALDDAGLAMPEVGNIVTASNDFLDGRTISGMAVGDACGAAVGDGKNISTVEGDGTFAAFYGMSRILSGAYETTLVVAHSKASEGDRRLISNACFDPIHERALGLDWISAAALQARACLDRGASSERDWAEAVARNRARGAANPRAQLRRPVSAEEVLASAPLASPIKSLDAAPLSDGAAAIVLARESFARRASNKPVWVEGAAFLADGRLTDRDLSRSQALGETARRAYRTAGISRPSSELGVAEISTLFSYQEPLWLEELGLSGMDKARVNPSGGCLCASAEVVSGLVRIIEAALQLRGEAASPVSADRALAHGQHGLCGQSHCVWVLGKN